MARIMKYEFIKNRFRYLIMAAILFLVKLLLCIICFVAYFVCLAYLSSTISASVLHCKKGGNLGDRHR